MLCDGDDLRVALVDRKLVVGEQLGAVPAETPSVPLVADVAATQRSLRMKPSALVTELDLDLRRDIDRNRSRLLHRLRLLGVPWGEPAEAEPWRERQGTFRESWQLAWEPEFAVDLIEASGYGTTVLSRRDGEGGRGGRPGDDAGRGDRAGRAGAAGRPAGRLAARAARRCRSGSRSTPTSPTSWRRCPRWPGPCATATCAAPTSARWRRSPTGWWCASASGCPPRVAALDDDAAAEMRGQPGRGRRGARPAARRRR